MNKKELILLEGTKEVIEALDSLEPKVLNNVIKSVQRKALMEHIVKPLRAAIPYASLKKAAGLESVMGKHIGYFAGIVNRKKIDAKPEGVIIRFLTGGTKVRTTKKGYNRGKVEGDNFVKPVIQGNIKEVIEFFNNDFGTEVEKILQKKLKKINS